MDYLLAEIFALRKIFGASPRLLLQSGEWQCVDKEVVIAVTISPLLPICFVCVLLFVFVFLDALASLELVLSLTPSVRFFGNEIS